MQQCSTVPSCSQQGPDRYDDSKHPIGDAPQEEEDMSFRLNLKEQYLIVIAELLESSEEEGMNLNSSFLINSFVKSRGRFLLQIVMVNLYYC